MPRRTKTKNSIIKKAGFAAGRAKNFRKNLRFDVSLVILIGMLVFSTLLFLVALNKSLVKKTGAVLSGRLPNIQSHGMKKAGSCPLKDPSIDFELTIPDQLDDWMYKTGYVKSPVDDSLSDHYVQIFVPVAGAVSNNFEDQNKNILTVLKFSQNEWDKLERGCQKGNEIYCEGAGKMLAEKDGSVYAYKKFESCPKSIEAKCNLAEKIIQSFKLK